MSEAAKAWGKRLRETLREISMVGSYCEVEEQKERNKNLKSWFERQVRLRTLELLLG